MKPPLDASLRSEYESRYGMAFLRSVRTKEAQKVIQRILYGQRRYEAVSEATRVPWYVIAVIHQMECDGDFECHLHNGDPLTAKTHHVPAGRPIEGQPPFTWEQSACDALSYQGMAQWTDWSLSGTLYQLEGYNGFGYRNHSTASPYLWGGTDVYRRGKYVKDGVWNGFAVSDQIGAAILLKLMSQEGAIPWPDPVTPICEVN